MTDRWVALLATTILGALLLLPPDPAAASTVVLLDDLGLVNEAATIVHGDVVAVTPRVARDGVRIFSEVEIRPREMLKGLADPDGLVRFRHWGGALGGRLYMIPGAARFTVGEEVVAFLAATDAVEKAGFTVGLAQGAFYVARPAEAGGGGAAGTPAAPARPDVSRLKATIHRRFAGLSVVDGATGRPVEVDGREAGRDLEEFKTLVRTLVR